MSRRLTLCLSGLAVVLGLMVFDRLGQAPGLDAIELPPASPARRLEAPEGPTVPRLDSLRETRERPLFLASRRAPKPEVVAAGPASEPAPLNYDLVGITLFDDRRIALLRHRGGGRLLRVTEGQRLDRWRVTGVDPDRLQVRWSGTLRELRLKDAKRVAGPAPRRRAPDAEPAPPAAEDQSATEAAAKSPEDAE